MLNKIRICASICALLCGGTTHGFAVKVPEMRTEYITEYVTKTEYIEKAPNNDDYRVDLCIITDVDYAQDIVTAVTDYGHTFQWSGCEDWLVGYGAAVLVKQSDQTVILHHAVATRAEDLDYLANLAKTVKTEKLQNQLDYLNGLR